MIMISCLVTVEKEENESATIEMYQIDLNDKKQN